MIDALVSGNRTAEAGVTAGASTGSVTGDHVRKSAVWKIFFDCVCANSVEPPAENHTCVTRPVADEAKPRLMDVPPTRRQSGRPGAAAIAVMVSTNTSTKASTSDGTRIVPL